jgi:hypothetical protein
VRISGIIFTHHLPEETLPWIGEARDIFDEMVIFIDEKRTTPNTVDRAKSVATRVLYNKADTWYGADGPSLVAGCKSDWLFVLDYDEQLSLEWQQQDQWRQILETTPFTHFWFPRRWIVPTRQYINCEPWWPDFQLRLFRNNFEGAAFPERLHETIRASGPGAYFQNLAIHHHVLQLFSRTQREDKVRYYEQLRPGGALGHLYLYEDYRTRHEPLPQPVELNVNTELAWMDKLHPEDILKLSVKVCGVPEAVPVSELFWLNVEVTNASSEAICSSPPFPVRLSYHWIDKALSRTVTFDGERSALFPCLHPGATMTCSMKVKAPERPGQYVLQTSMLQENVRWFEEIRPEILQEFDIFVTV